MKRSISPSSLLCLVLLSELEVIIERKSSRLMELAEVFFLFMIKWECVVDFQTWYTCIVDIHRCW
jgi:hypothetical protein